MFQYKYKNRDPYVSLIGSVFIRIPRRLHVWINAICRNFYYLILAPLMVEFYAFQTPDSESVISFIILALFVSYTTLFGRTFTFFFWNFITMKYFCWFHVFWRFFSQWTNWHYFGELGSTLKLYSKVQYNVKIQSLNVVLMYFVVNKVTLFFCFHKMCDMSCIPLIFTKMWIYALPIPYDSFGK